MRSLSTGLMFVSLVSLTSLAACGGATKEAKTASDPWADFKGTYAGAQAPRGDGHASAAEGDATGKEARREAAPSSKGKAEAADDVAAETADAPAKPSKAKIKGVSLSSIADDALADAAKGALKKKVVSTTVMTGAKYEQVKVRLDGAVVMIVRPVPAEEAGNGAVDAPKTRIGSLSSTEASFYDEEADVLVTVEAGKKNTSEKALGAIVAR